MSGRCHRAVTFAGQPARGRRAVGSRTASARDQIAPSLAAARALIARRHRASADPNGEFARTVAYSPI
jgi:hypothetical protein